MVQQGWAGSHSQAVLTIPYCAAPAVLQVCLYTHTVALSPACFCNRNPSTSLPKWQPSLIHNTYTSFSGYMVWVPVVQMQQLSLLRKSIVERLAGKPARAATEHYHPLRMKLVLAPDKINMHRDKKCLLRIAIEGICMQWQQCYSMLHKMQQNSPLTATDSCRHAIVVTLHWGCDGSAREVSTATTRPANLSATATPRFPVEKTQPPLRPNKWGEWVSREPDIFKIFSSVYAMK